MRIIGAEAERVFESALALPPLEASPKKLDSETVTQPLLSNVTDISAIIATVRLTMNGPKRVFNG